MLNRVGRTSEDLDGSSVAGMDVTLDDSAATNIHDAGIFEMSFKPDGRNIDPLDSFGSVEPTSFLSNFNGLDPNGTWTLFVADLAPGDQSTVLQWGVTISAVPEPTQMCVIILIASGLLLRHRKPSSIR
ncbi:hypothetical protein [Haloferula sp.]|uniref:hypothetical protein n=1 Tax=Haloferula sp. TaxID=2497595 RepID=UPI003C745700